MAAWDPRIVELSKPPCIPELIARLLECVEDTPPSAWILVADTRNNVVVWQRCRFQTCRFDPISPQAPYIHRPQIALREHCMRKWLLETQAVVLSELSLCSSDFERFSPRVTRLPSCPIELPRLRVGRLELLRRREGSSAFHQGVGPVLIWRSEPPVVEGRRLIGYAHHVLAPEVRGLPDLGVDFHAG